jgi:hypothetical protein
MDEETRQAFAELRTLMNDQFERVLNRLTRMEGEVRDLRTEHAVTRDLVTKLPGTVLGAIEQPLLRRITDIERRLGDLEGHGPASGLGRP